MTINSIYDKIRSIADFHRMFRDSILLITNTNGYQSNYDQSYILNRCKIYALEIFCYISLALCVICLSLMFQPSIRAFFGFGIAALIFAMCVQVSIEKEIDLRLFGKPNAAYQTNETGFALIC